MQNVLSDKPQENAYSIYHTNNEIPLNIAVMKNSTKIPLCMIVTDI